jgi:hypothetical protein
MDGINQRWKDPLFSQILQIAKQRTSIAMAWQFTYQILNRLDYDALLVQVEPILDDLLREHESNSRPPTPQ